VRVRAQNGEIDLAVNIPRISERSSTAPQALLSTAPSDPHHPAHVLVKQMEAAQADVPTRADSRQRVRQHPYAIDAARSSRPCLTEGHPVPPMLPSMHFGYDPSSSPSRRSGEGQSLAEAGFGGGVEIICTAEGRYVDGRVAEAVTASSPRPASRPRCARTTS